MKELLKALHDKFYEPLPEVELKREMEDCHRALIEVLGKPERRLVLQIIDCKDQIAKNLSIDSFICGFHLAWQMANELNIYQKGRPVPTRTVGVDVLSASCVAKGAPVWGFETKRGACFRAKPEFWFRAGRNLHASSHGSRAAQQRAAEEDRPQPQGGRSRGRTNLGNDHVRR